ncbi:hypothetical protein [Geothrix paludis]|uniref:hypothetical protein n=1 Tax=Geothrix paludis TaxID=2922722 RepID=UPI001FAE22A8|nr:hypothetical protein [Geothrix paludis]
MPLGPEDLADGEPSCLPGLAARLISRARELRRVKRRHGGVLMMPWQGRQEAVRFLYWKGRVLIQEEDAGTPWGAALFLALEGIDAQRAGIWRKGGAR